MFKWKKLGRVFNPTDIDDRPWMEEFAQAPCTLIFDDFVRVYFSCRPSRDANGQYVSYSAFVDLDRRDLFSVLRVSEEPVIRLSDTGAGAFDEFGTYPVSVVRVGSLVYAYYGGWTRCESVPFNVSIGLAISHDNGKTFCKHSIGPILSYSPEDPFIVSDPKVRVWNDIFYLFYIAGMKWIVGRDRPEPVYKIRLATSANGVDWVKANKDLIDTRLDDWYPYDEEAQASPDVIFANGRYHMFFSYRYSTDYKGEKYEKKRGYRIGYASAEHPLDWARDDSLVGIDVSKDGWDSDSISYPHVFELGGETYMFYLGNEVGRYGFGLAVLEGEL